MWPKHGFARCWHFSPSSNSKDSLVFHVRDSTMQPTCSYASNSSSSALPLTPISYLQLLSIFYFASTDCQIIFSFSQRMPQMPFLPPAKPAAHHIYTYYRWKCTSYGLTRLSALETCLPLLKSHFKACIKLQPQISRGNFPLLLVPLWSLRLFPLDLGRLQE